MLAAKNSPNVFVIAIFSNATVLFGIVTSYSEKQTNFKLNLPFLLSKPVKSSAQNALVISLARSGRKLKNTTESFSLIVAIALPSFATTVGTTNSSVTSSA